MFDGLVNSNNLSFILVFLEGVLSFFSPCVIPLIPVYMSYLAGNAKEIGQDGTITYERKKVFFHTVFFVLGISFAFFILGMSFSVLGNFFYRNKVLFTRIGGILIIILGLFQLGVFDFKFLQKERKFHLNLGEKKVNPLVALFMGFTFSFAWTPCIGPALSSVLILASGAKEPALGNMLVLIYTLGFVIPFLALGLFTTQVLAFLKSKQKFLKYTIKVGGIILLIIGFMTFTGWMNGISSYLNSFGSNFTTKNNSKSLGEIEDTEGETPEDKIEEENTEEQDIKDNQEGSMDAADSDTEKANDNSKDSKDSDTVIEEEEEPVVYPAIEFTLLDQYGEEHTLSDYKGKVVFLNFWATWCPPCQKEMPHIEEIYKEYNLNEEDIIILGVANPKSDEYPNNADEEKEDIIAFLEENEYTFPTVFDETGEIFEQYFISAYPTTFMINKEGNIFGYVSGMLTKDMMYSIIEDTIKSTE